MISRFIFSLSLALCAAVSFVSVAQAQTTSSSTTATSSGPSPVLVYKLTFTSMGDSINFRSYQGGYIVFDVGISGSNAGTVVLTQIVGGARKYYTIKDYGQMFFATKGKEVKAVMTGNKSTTPGTTTSGSTTSTSSAAAATTSIFMYAIGSASDQLDLDLRNGSANVTIAKSMKGYGIFCDSQEDLPFASAAGEDVGTAGAVSLTLAYDEGLSTFSEKNNSDRATMITKIQTQLANESYTNGDATTTATGSSSSSKTSSSSSSSSGTGSGSGTGTTGR